MAFTGAAQDSLKYWIQFTDKQNNGYSIEQPERFLSPRSLQRRQRQQIPVTEQDLPVTQRYVDSLRAMGCNMLHTSRWFNAATVSTNDTTLIDRISQLPFVAGQRAVAYLRLQPDQEMDWQEVEQRSYKLRYDYGEGYNQIGMVKGDLLHDEGYTGQGMLIAVMDAGFPMTDILAGFQTLRNEGRLLGGHDFVAPGTSLYEDHPHGTAVLSVMAAYLPGTFVGTAPAATYVLLRTEDAVTELTIEEHNWIAAAEYADSIGADVLNTSLGYTYFDHAEMSYTYSDMDGATTWITRGADVAAQKGMIVVASAGNSGNDAWQYVGAPADGDSVFAIGAVTPEGGYASFSSRGPTADGRVKPDVSAQGQQTIILSFVDGEVRTASGTSFSGPLVAGLMACLWQAHPDKSAWDIIEAVRKSAHQYDSPDGFLGYGIPNFMNAHTALLSALPATANELIAFPNPFADRFQLTIPAGSAAMASLSLSNTAGQTVWERLVDLPADTRYTVTSDNLSALPPGAYQLTLLRNGEPQTITIIKGR